MSSPALRRYALYLDGRLIRRFRSDLEPSELVIRAESAGLFFSKFRVGLDTLSIHFTSREG